MIVLHASWGDGAPELWTERKVLEENISAPPPGRLPSYPGPLLFDGGEETIRKAIAAAELRLPPEFLKGAFLTRYAWLPTQGKRPVPSSPVICAVAPSSGRCHLVPWEVVTLPVHISFLTELTAFASREDYPVRGVLPGRDLFWLASLCRLGLDLVMRQRYLPSLSREETGFRACWEPWLEEVEEARLSELARVMPDSIRCLRARGDRRPPDVSPDRVVRTILACLVDGLVREVVSGMVHWSQREFDSIDEAWMAFLGQGYERKVLSASRAVSEFASRLERWKRPLDLAASSSYRLCFRLEEPAEEEETWTVRLLVQPRQDPSLLFPVADVWKGSEGLLGGDALEYLLLAMGQAGGLCPDLKKAGGAVPWGWETDSSGAFRFLGEQAPALESSGFGVLLPSWWSPRGRRKNLTVQGRVKAPGVESSGGLGMDAMLDVDWSLALGDREVSLSELEDLARIKAPLVKFRGEWTELSPEAIRTAVDFMKKQVGKGVSARQILKESLAGETEGQMAVSGLELEGWIEDLVRRLRGQGVPQSLAVPEGLQATLRPYQVRGYAWLDYLSRWGLGACLADDMGLGKTIQALTLVARRSEEGETRPVLLVCPTSVLNNWEREAARFVPDLNVHLHHGPSRWKGEKFLGSVKDVHMVVTGYALLSRDAEFLQRVDWAGIILDEAQNIKNPETAQSKAARALRADYRLALTGTPVENHVGDLWSLMDFLNPGFLGSRSGFRKNFFLPIQRAGDAEAVERLRGLTKPFILRRLKTDPEIVPDLPEKLEMKVWCTLGREQATLYRAVLRELEASLEGSEGIKRKGLVLASLSKLKQICNHPAHFLGDGSRIEGRSGKLARLTEMVEVLMDSGDRALIFTQFREMGELLRNHLTETFGREVLFLHGGVPRKKRDEMVRRFQEEEKGPPLFILSLKAGGTGLNLTRATHVFHYDRWWNPSVEDQATDRAYRIGQRKDVQVHKFLCAGTLEERIDDLIEGKKKVASEIVGTGEGWLTELSDGDFKELVALGREAVKN